MKKVLFSLVAMLLLSVSGIAQTTFTKVTSTSGLEAGANYLIVAHYDDLGVLAMGYQKTSNRNAVIVEEDGDAITVTLGTDPSSETDVFQFTLGGSTGAWTLYDEVKGGYLYASSSSSNQLKTQTTLDANGQWSISFNDDGTAEVVAQGENERNNMRFNPNSSNNAPLFSCYAETSNIDTRVSFYKAGGTPAPPQPEPTNYPTNFNVDHVVGVDVTLVWNDSEGGQLPDGYLVRASTGNITIPEDHVVYSSNLDKYVNYGVQTVTFSGLEGGTAYHFAIFPYTNNGANIDYKTDGNYPMDNATTENIFYLLNENFESDDFESFIPYDLYGEQSWRIASYNGNKYAYMNGYANGAPHKNIDWLISPEMNGMFQNITLQFKTAKNYSGLDLELLISTDYDGASEPTEPEFHWTPLTVLFDWSSGEYEWIESGVVDITEYTGEHFYIAYVYESTDEEAASWEVDDVKVIAYNPLSVAENSNTQLVVSPNPAHEQISFVLESDAQVSVFDMMGRKVNETECKAGQAQINVNELESGVYFVNIRFANGSTAVSKFVKF